MLGYLRRVLPHLERASPWGTWGKGAGCFCKTKPSLRWAEGPGLWGRQTHCSWSRRPPPPLSHLEDQLKRLCPSGSGLFWGSLPRSVGLPGSTSFAGNLEAMHCSAQEPPPPFPNREHECRRPPNPRCHRPRQTEHRGSPWGWGHIWAPPTRAVPQQAPTSPGTRSLG